MTDQPVVKPEILRRWQSDQTVLIVDCRFDLTDPDAGREAWLAAHIPGAVYADLDKDLAAEVTDQTGRHPLPSAEQFAQFLSRCGWTPGTVTVVYDAGSGAFAARLWWLMRYFALHPVYVLDGGLMAWEAQGGATESGVVKPKVTSAPDLSGNKAMVLDAFQVASGLASGDVLLVDARDGARFRGEAEPIDTRAGHVPGAVNHPFQANLDHGGQFLPPEALRSSLGDLTGGRPLEQIVHMCGSGVTACHNLLAMELAGLQGSRLYVGSWSEWIRDPARPVAQGSA